ncbi:MAG: TonB-dependent receptor plug domain-containing protein, partial [Pseudomonadales bacterium]
MQITQNKPAVKSNPISMPRRSLSTTSSLCSIVVYVACHSQATLAGTAIDTSKETPSKKPIEEVVIEANKNTIATEFGLSTFKLSGDELTTKMGATLGETLANEPGVHNASYGPGVGLPVLRGLSGVRIRLSEDGIGAWDASSISPDHATAIEPAIAES